MIDWRGLAWWGAGQSFFSWYKTSAPFPKFLSLPAEHTTWCQLFSEELLMAITEWHGIAETSIL